MDRSSPVKDRLMSFVMLALLIAFAAATALVLADSGLRLWSALGGLKAQRLALASGPLGHQQSRVRSARMTTRVSYVPARPAQPAPRRAAA
jgi:hypothetical protein